MGQDVVVRSGPWGRDDVRAFLEQTVIPLRLATAGVDYPLVQSLWFLFDDEALWCCTRDDSVVARRLARQPRCSFELSRDNPPYRGVRGTGTATLLADAAASILPRLIDRYGQAGTSLADWLMGRLDHEVAIRIDRLAVSSWDYSPRMQGGGS